MKENILSRAASTLCFDVITSAAIVLYRMCVDVKEAVNRKILLRRLRAWCRMVS